jgi:hypothetical protein
MHNSNQMRFAMAIHMIERSNPATRSPVATSRTATRRHRIRAEAPVEHLTLVDAHST